MTKQELLQVAKPIIFSTEMVKAILDGRKTQTRRVAKEVVSYADRSQVEKRGLIYSDTYHDVDLYFEPQYRRGDFLYVRETWFMEDFHRTDGGFEYIYKADNENYPACDFQGGWRPSIHMPKEAARVFLKVTDVWVEHLCEISEDDALCEGCDGEVSGTSMIFAVDEFRILWDSIYAKRGYGWDANPWVFVYVFERVEVEV